MAAALFLAFWWNRFLGLSLDGYMPWFGHRILAGEIPYRDFFLHLPPLHPLAEAALEAFFGKSILAGRVAGASVHLLMAAVAAAWLARSYRPSLAVFGAVAALAVASADETEILDLYNPHAALAALVSGYLVAIALDGGRRRRIAGWLAGSAAAVAFGIKQTVGLGATVAVPVALALFALHDPGDRRPLLRVGLRFAAGWMLIAGSIAGWLAAHGALDDFFRQVFLNAAGSKGSPMVLLTRPWTAPFDLAMLALPARLALFLAVALAALGSLSTPSSRRPTRAAAWLSAGLGLAFAAALIAGGPWITDRLLVRNGPSYLLPRVRLARNLSVLFSLYGVTLLGVRAAGLASLRRLSSGERELTLFSVVAAAITLSQSLSFAATGAAAFPALALLVAHGGELAQRLRARWLAPLVLAVAAFALLAAVEIHHRGAFDFAGWKEPPPAEATERSVEPALAGLTLSRATQRTVDGVLEILRRATDPGEAILTFPVYPLFHWLADRPTATFASLHWIDVTPDPVVDADLAELERRPPIAVVRQWIPPEVLTLNEEYFRAGRESALRRMHAALDRLLDEHYRKVFVAPRRRYGGYPRLEVWVLEERARERGLTPIR